MREREKRQPHPTVRAGRFLGKNAWALAHMAVAGFAVMWVADPGDLDDPQLRETFLENIRTLRDQVPKARALQILEALSELHPNAEKLRAMVALLRTDA